jgi:hypothetical protein
VSGQLVAGGAGHGVELVETRGIERGHQQPFLRRVLRAVHAVQAAIEVGQLLVE